MYSRKATIAASVGLHARPAAVFVRAVNQSGLPVTLSKAGLAPVDARSLLAVKTADFECGQEVEVSVTDTEDHGSVRTVIDSLAALLETDLTD